MTSARPSETLGEGFAFFCWSRHLRGVHWAYAQSEKGRLTVWCSLPEHFR